MEAPTGRVGRRAGCGRSRPLKNAHSPSPALPLRALSPARGLWRVGEGHVGGPLGGEEGTRERRRSRAPAFPSVPHHLHTPPPSLQLENGTLRVFKKIESRAANATHGLVRALASNMVTGTSVGFTKTMTMTGVGYRAAVANNVLTLNLGYSHPVEMPVPTGLTVTVEKATTLHVSGADKCQVGQFAADVRKLRPPEPYKGKGIRYEGEYVRRKEGKRGK